MMVPLLPAVLLTTLLGPVPMMGAGAPVPTVAVAQDRDPNTCAAYAEWLGATEMTAPRDGSVPLTLLTAVGSGAQSFCRTDVTFSVAFFDRAGAIVCSGQVDLRAFHDGLVTYTNIELQPGNIYQFMRWVNGPRAISQQWARVPCTSADGQTEAQASDLARMQSLRLHAIVPGNTSLGVAELRVSLRP